MRKRFSKAEDELIAKAPQCEWEALAAELDRTYGSIRARYFRLNAGVERQAKPQSPRINEDYSKPKCAPKSQSPLPFARPSWFDEPSPVELAMGRRP